MAAETTQYVFKHRDLVLTMVKAQNLHEGCWTLLVNFGFSAANVGPTANDVYPTAIIPITGIGLQRVDSVINPNMTVDAAKENPA